MDQIESPIVPPLALGGEAVCATLLAHMPDVVWRLDRALRFLYVNPAIVRWTGQVPAAFVGKTGAEAGLRDSVWQAIAEKCREAFVSARMTPLEFIDDTPQGRRHFLLRLIPEFDDSTGANDVGGATLLGIMTDMTEQRPAQPAQHASESSFHQRADHERAAAIDRGADILDAKGYAKALRESEEKLALATDAAGLGVFDHDLRNNTMYWNERAAALWGIARGLPMTREVMQARVHPDYRGETAEALQRALDPAGNGRLYHEYRVVTGVGEAVRWVGSTGRVLFEQGQPVRRIGVIQDITERKLAQQRELLEKDELLLLAEKAGNLGRSEWLVQSGTLHLSPRMLAIYGAGSFDGRQESWTRMIHADDSERVRDTIAEVFDRYETSFALHYRVVRPDGSIYWLESHYGVSYDDERRPIRVVGQNIDVTVRKEVERRLIEANESLRQMSLNQARLIENERSRIARNLHDGVGQLLYLAGLKLSAATRMALGKALRGTLEDVFGVIGRATRDIRSIEFELSPPQLRQFGLLSALAWLAEDMERQFGLVVEITDDPLDKPLDPFMSAILYRAVRELLINVAKHAKVDSASIVVRRKCAVIEITVQDRGVGMRGEDIISSERGLGLREMRETLVSGGGAFTIISPADGGTVATLTAPLMVTTDAHSQPSRPSRADSGMRPNTAIENYEISEVGTPLDGITVAPKRTP